MQKRTFLVTLAVATLLALADSPAQENGDANKKTAEQSLKVIAAIKAKESQIAALKVKGPQTTTSTQKKLPAPLSGMVKSPPSPPQKPSTLKYNPYVPRLPLFSVVSSAALYKSGDPISLTLTMVGSYDVLSICTFAPSVISAVYVRRDGKAVAPTYTITDLPDDPYLLQLMSYVKIPDAGGVTELPFPLGISPTGNPQINIGGTVGAHSLVVKSPVTNTSKVIDVPAYRTTTYELGQPGFYTIKLRYTDGWVVVDSNEVVFAIK
jgi:hypothetical protein